MEGLRVVYVDQYDAHVLDDVGYARFGPAAKAIEWGIAVHQGQQFGAINRYVMLAGCLAIAVLAISAVTMWWKRRPKRSLGLAPSPADARVYRGLFAIVVPLAILIRWWVRLFSSRWRSKASSRLPGTTLRCVDLFSA